VRIYVCRVLRNPETARVGLAGFWYREVEDEIRKKKQESPQQKLYASRDLFIAHMS